MYVSLDTEVMKGNFHSGYRSYERKLFLPLRIKLRSISSRTRVLSAFFSLEPGQSFHIRHYQTHESCGSSSRNGRFVEHSAVIRLLRL